ncbi:23S rRNA (guanosine(2251)-2'-O)-methyltransferase RlmB [Brevundimonas denitrificans]|uniref:23S rRNA (guanosine(2251)-2'-O)-methyltransferase RlmB n=1 Tax=Brevundimonas denitrificans TaxID=1443434 RepID=UPI00223BAD73|nr:23S rRNA (guanosine(2251)-2'-O)-methyltransferase RlmB [Brevundimonas denitrificans]
MSSNRERNDRKPKKTQGFKPRPERGLGAEKRLDRAERFGAEGAASEGGAGQSDLGPAPGAGALANPARKGMGRLLATQERAEELASGGLNHGHQIEVMDGPTLARMVPPGAVHQGLVFKVAPLEGVTLEEIAEPAEGVIVMLDQITDPQNVGAVFRSALAFGAKGIVVQDRHSPALAGALAKAAAGATERLPCVRATNLSRALERLGDLGWRAVGMDGSAEMTLDAALDARPTVIVMGSEGDGIRRLVAEHCEVLAKIPMPGGFESLNVSNAAAIALYEATRAQKRHG